MKTIFRSGLLIIEVIFLCILSFEAITYCEDDQKVNVRRGNIFIMGEQSFWKDWILHNDPDSSPLQPFVLSVTKPMIEKLDRKITQFGKTDYALLLIDVNIDNGISYFYYAAWNKDDRLIKSLEWGGLNKKIIAKKIKVEAFVDMAILEKMSKKDIVVDVKDKSHFDKDSVYLILLSHGRLSRFAFYNPSFVAVDRTTLLHRIFQSLEK